MKKIVLWGFALAASGLVACGNQVTTQAPTESAREASTREVNVYSSRHYDTDEALYDQFTEATGIEINLIEGKADELIQRLLSEGGNSPADLFITVDAGTLWRADNEGLFQPTESDALESSIPENLRHPEGHWFGLTQRARVIIYNPDRVEPEDLSTYEALAGPEWQGRVCIRSSSNIYNQSLLASLIENDGREAAVEWASGMVNNFARDPEGGDTDQIRGVAVGVCDVAIANHYYWARLVNSDSPQDNAVAEATAVFFPNQDDRGTHVNITGAGVLANSPNSDEAVEFLEYLATPEAQAIFAVGNNEYPAVEGADVSDTVEDLGEFETDSLNVAAFGARNPDAIAVFDEVGWR